MCKNSTGFFIMIGLIILGAMIPISVKTVTDSSRTVAVKGLCEKEVPADKVIWPIKFKVPGNEFDTVCAELEKKTGKVTDFLQKGGVKADDISVGMPSVSDKYAQEYGNNDRAFRYLASVTVTVCSKDVSTVMALMNRQGELMRYGIAPEYDWESHASFYFEGLNDIKPEMIQDATENAREVALKFASDSKSKLGKIKTASQGTFSIEDRDANTPSIKKVRVVTAITYYLSN